MTGIFKSKNPANIFLLLLLAVLLKLPLFKNTAFEQPLPEGGLLYKGITDLLKQASASIPKIVPFLTFTLLTVQALMLNRVMNSQRMTGKPTYLSAMAYLLVTSLLPVWNRFSAPLLVNTVFIFILSMLLSTYNNEKAKGSIFNTGLAAGIASFIFFPSLAFLFWMLMALMIIRPFKLNEWALCIAGVTAPYYFFAVYMFITGNNHWKDLFPGFTVSLPYMEPSAWIAGSAFLIVVPFLAGAYFVQNNLRRMLIQVRKGWSLLLLYILVAFLIPFIGDNSYYETWIIAAVPFAAFHACAYLYPTYRIIPLLLFWITMAFVLAWQYYGPGWY